VVIAASVVDQSLPTGSYDPARRQAGLVLGLDVVLLDRRLGVGGLESAALVEVSA